uniref:Uncharacterized protein n=1 Tax=Aegilops tauschii TaxID=37682 RepID=M8BAM3_AEGTA
MGLFARGLEACTREAKFIDPRKSPPGWDALISGPDFFALHKYRSQPLLITGHDGDLQLLDMDGNIVRAVKMDGLFFIINYLFPGYAQVIDVASGEVILTCSRPAMRGNIVIGFGAATTSGVHKVVCITTETCEILALEDGPGWRKAQSPLISAVMYDIPVEIDGVLYVLASTKQKYQNPDTGILL